MTDYIRLKSGREIYANCGIFGLEDHNGKFSITTGYDNGLGDDLSNDDKREIADMMIERWTRFRLLMEGKWP